MRIKKTKIYKFNELSDEAKEAAIEKLWDINVYYEWWENIYYDAEETALLRLTSFDCDRYCEGNFIEFPEDTANKILAEHSNSYETFQTAREYKFDSNHLLYQYPINLDENGDDLNERDREQAQEELDNEFLKSLLEDYRIILQKEYEYLTSEEAIIETIEANEYEFTEDGELV